MKLTRQKHRTLVVISIFSAILFSASFTEGFNQTMRWLLLLLTLVSFSLLLKATDFLTFRNKKKLDERELFSRLKATDISYAFVFGYISIGIALRITTLNPLATEIHTHDLVQWFLLALMLPTVLIAWLEPDPIPDTTLSGEHL